MVAQRSLLFAAASAFTVSNVFAHPHGAHHAHNHAKRQDKFDLSYVTLYQTQAAGPNGNAVVYTVTSPVWVPAGAAATATGVVPLPSPAVTSSAIAVPASSKVADVQSSVSLDFEEAEIQQTEVAEAPVSSAIASSTAVVVAPPASSAAVVVAPPASSAVVEVAPPASSAVVEVAPPASSSVVPVASPAPETPSGGGTASGAYDEYSGVPSEFPTESEWLSFEAIFEASKGDASKGMASYGLTEEQMSSLSSGIKAAATKAGVDPRVVLAMAMQETRGVATTGGGGLIQATGASGQLCDGSWSDIETQLECGLGGVYAECVAKYPDSEPWVALRCYNSGINAVDATNLNTIGATGTAAYCTDIANRLVNGWTN